MMFIARGVMHLPEQIRIDVGGHAAARQRLRGVEFSRLDALRLSRRGVHG
jgi:hypothetical protein